MDFKVGGTRDGITAIQMDMKVDGLTYEIIEEDGSVFISAIDLADAERAMHTIKTIVEDPEIGAIYKGKVTRLMTFGAFVEIAPGKEGLVHILSLIHI